MSRYAVIMCGGAGTRFWPFSRETRPKQFIDFFGTGQSLLQLTVDRILPIVAEENILILTNEIYADLVSEQLPWLQPSQILHEPARRDTAPGMLWAAHHIASRQPDASVVFLPSDHVILKADRFHSDLMRGFEFIENADRLLAIGINPSAPNTSYTYLQKGEPFRGCESISRIKTVAERPEADMASIFIRSGEFLWNSGIFMGGARSIVEAFRRHATDLSSIFDVGEATYRGLGEQRFIAENFPKAESLPIEYALFECADNAYVMQTDIGWSDLSTWKALHELSPKNKEGNVTQNCRTLLYDSRRCIVSAEGDKVVVVAGLDDYIVADTGNALLVCPIESEQRIRNIVNDIRERFGPQYL